MAGISSQAGVASFRPAPIPFPASVVLPGSVTERGAIMQTCDVRDSITGDAVCVRCGTNCDCGAACPRTGNGR